MSPAPFRIYNALTRAVETFSPHRAGTVQLQLCAATARLEHARASVTADVLARYLRLREWEVSLSGENEQPDIHAGELAENACAPGHAPPARYYLLTAAFSAGGESLDAVLQRFPAGALRLYYLLTHYRSPLSSSLDAPLEALGLLARLYEAREVAAQMEGDEPVERIVRHLGRDAATVFTLASTFHERFVEAMDDDLNTATALGYAIELARAVNRLGNHKMAKTRGGPVAREALAAFDELGESLGIFEQGPADFIEEIKDKRLPVLGLTREEVDQKLAARLAARADKNWERADTLRGELEAKGIQIMDRTGGVDWRIRLSAE